MPLGLLSTIMVLLVLVAYRMQEMARQAIMDEGADWDKTKRTLKTLSWWERIRLARHKMFRFGDPLMSSESFLKQADLVRVMLVSGVSARSMLRVGFGTISRVGYALHHKQIPAALEMMEWLRKTEGEPLTPWEIRSAVETGDPAVHLEVLRSGADLNQLVNGRPLFWWAILSVAYLPEEDSLAVGVLKGIEDAQVDLNWIAETDGDYAVSETVLEEVVLVFGCPWLARRLIKLGASPTAGWKRETVIEKLAKEMGVPREEFMASREDPSLADQTRTVH